MAETTTGNLISTDLIHEKALKMLPEDEGEKAAMYLLEELKYD